MKARGRDDPQVTTEHQPEDATGFETCCSQTLREKRPQGTEPERTVAESSWILTSVLLLHKPKVKDVNTMWIPNGKEDHSYLW